MGILNKGTRSKHWLIVHHRMRGPGFILVALLACFAVNSEGITFLDKTSTTNTETSVTSDKSTPTPTVNTTTPPPTTTATTITETSQSSTTTPEANPDQSMTFGQCGNITQQAIEITSLVMDPYPIKFDCNDDHNYCGPPYLMNYSLNVSENIPNDTIVELVVMVKLYHIFIPIPCVDELPPLPPQQRQQPQRGLIRSFLAPWTFTHYSAVAHTPRPLGAMKVLATPKLETTT